MLSNSPKNGVELMDDIEKMTQGWWRPSPGSIYPLLEQLSSEGLIRKRDDGRYELTDKASEELEWAFGSNFRKRPSVDEMINEIGGFVSYLEEIGRADPSKTTPYQQRVKDLAQRLAVLSKDASEQN